MEMDKMEVYNCEVKRHSLLMIYDLVIVKQ